MFDILTGTPEELIITDPNEEQSDDVGIEDDNADVDVTIEDPNADEADSEPEAGDDDIPKDEAGQVVESWQQKYKSPQEMYDALQKLEESYNNIRPEFTRKSQELAELKKAVTKPDVPAVLPTEVNNPEDVVALINAAVALRTEEAIAPIKEHAEMLEMETALNRLSKSYTDLEGHIPTMLAILQEDPYLWNGGTEKALKSAYLQSKGASVNESVEKIIEKTLADKDQIKAIKQKTAERSKASPQRVVTTSDEDDIVAGIMAISKSNPFF